MRTSGFAKFGAVCAGALALLIAGAPAAVAEPVPAGFRSYAAVGSGTADDVWNGLSNGVAGINGGVGVVPSVASYNAFGTPATIQTKSGGPSYTRPDSSGYGEFVLSASNNSPFSFRGVNIQNQVDFARSSSRPSSASPGSNLRYLPFARDAVSVVGRGLASGITNFTTGELTRIYGCLPGTTGNVTVSGTTVTYNNGATVNQVLRPVVPYGSYTRELASDILDSFLSAIGVATPGSCVSATTVRENDGTQLTLTGQVVPFSAAQWIAQKNGVVTNTVSNAALRITSLNGSAPTAGSGTALTPGSLYGFANVPPATGGGVFARDTYSVADSSDINLAGADTALEATLTASVGTTNARAVIARYGFVNLGYLGVEGNYLSSGYTN